MGSHDDDAILKILPLGFPWGTSDPFLFCVHHDDRYPRGNDRMGPQASLEGRELGQDFQGKDGWRMYHGEEVPGFPPHPHRGFETVTIVRRGLIDHSDSLGAAARFGRGDVQWLTAGKGIVHAEMFPLLDREQPNPVELFQIWLNLPAEDKMVEPHFTMLWGQDLPKLQAEGVEVVAIAGRLGELQPPPPPPKSWAARPDTDVAIWTIKLQPHAGWTVPPARPGTKRTLYFFKGTGLTMNGQDIPTYHGVEVTPEAPLALRAGPNEAELLLLQGRPIDQPVVQYGPFVMNSGAEIQQAIQDYQRTQFGGWPWPSDEPVHPRGEGRFAKHADGKTEAKSG